MEESGDIVHIEEKECLGAWEILFVVRAHVYSRRSFIELDVRSV